MYRGLVHGAVSGHPSLVDALWVSCIPNTIWILPKYTIVAPDAVVQVKLRAYQLAMRIPAASTHKVVLDNDGRLAAALYEFVGKDGGNRREQQ